MPDLSVYHFNELLFMGRSFLRFLVINFLSVLRELFHRVLFISFEEILFQFE